MRENLRFCVLGGDLRQVCLAELLAADGHAVRLLGFERLRRETAIPPLESPEQLTEADCLVFPLPAMNRSGALNTPFSAADWSLSALWPMLRPRQVLCGGRITPELAAAAAAHGLRFHDYYAREELAVANAVPTAEGAIQIAMEELPVTIQGSRVLLLGFGRIGKLLARRLWALGAAVTVAARSCEELAWIEALGYAPLSPERLSGRLGDFDLLINTIPARLLTEDDLLALSPGCVCIDLASAPGGAERRIGTCLSAPPHTLCHPKKGGTLLYGGRSNSVPL